MKKFLLFLFAVFLFAGAAVAENELLYDLQFGKKSTTGEADKGISSYTGSFGFTLNSGEKFTISNFNNNNNNWDDEIRCGSKNAASVATITSDAPFAKSVVSIELGIKSMTVSSVNSIYVEISPDKSNWSNVGTFTLPSSNITALTNITLNIENVETDLYYRICFDCKQGSNGLLGLSYVKFYYTPEVVIPGVPDPVNIDVTSIDKYSASVTLTCPTTDATIYYGFSEDAISNEYTETLTIDNPGTIYAVAKIGETVGKISKQEIKVANRPGPGNGGDVKIVFSDLGYEKNDRITDIECYDTNLTIAVAQNGGTAAQYYDEARIYTKNILSVKAEEGWAITKIVATSTETKYALNATVNTGNLTTSGVSTTWTGDAPEVNLTLTQQWRAVDLTITYQKVPEDVVITNQMDGEVAKVTLTCPTVGVEIYYVTTEGEENDTLPENATFTLYAGTPFTMASTGYVFAYGVNKGAKGAISSKKVNVSDKPEPVVIESVIGDHKATVTLTTETAGATIYYSWSDAEDAVYTEYKETFETTSGGTLYAYAIKDGIKSEVTSKEIETVIIPADVTIVCTPEKPRFHASVAIECETEGATIKYGFNENEINTIYTEPLSLTQAATIYAYSEIYGEKSEVKSFEVNVSNDGNVNIIAKELGLDNGSLVTALNNVDDSDITVTFSKGKGSNDPKYYTSGESIRVYNNNTITVSAPEGYEIVSVTMTANNSSNAVSVTPNVGKVTKNGAEVAWDGQPVNSIVFTQGSGTGYIEKMYVLYAPVDANRPEVVEVSDKLNEEGYPVVTMVCPTEGAIIKYSIDNDAMDQTYSEPVILTEVGEHTIYAIAENKGSYSYTKTEYPVEVPMHYATLKDAVTSSTTQEADVYVVGNFEVLYQNGKYLVLTDGESNALIYNDATEYAVGTKISTIHAEIDHFNGRFQFINANLIEGGDGATYAAKEVADLASLNVADNLFDEVVIKGCDITDFENQEGVITLNGVSIALYNTFGIEGIGNTAGCDVRGFVSVSNGELRIVPTEVVGGQEIPTIEDPIFTPADGSLEAGQEIIIYCPTPGTAIYYTMDGSEPTEESEKYDAQNPIVFKESCTIKAKAFSADAAVRMNPSHTVTAVFDLFDPSAPNVIDFNKPGEINFGEGFVLPGTKNDPVTNIVNPFSKGNIVITVENAKGNTTTRFWNASGTYQLRVYNGNKFTINGPKDGKYYISEIKFDTAAGTIVLADGESGQYNNKVWTASEYVEPSDVTFSVSSNVQIRTITVILAPCKPKIVQPVFNPESTDLEEGDTIEITCETPGTAIYYTIDGTDPDQKTGTLYEAPIEFEAAMAGKTIKARAFSADSNVAMLPSEIAEATYYLYDRSDRADINYQIDFNDACGLEHYNILPTGTVIPTEPNQSVLVNGTLTFHAVNIDIAPAAELVCTGEASHPADENLKGTEHANKDVHAYTYELRVEEGATITFTLDSESSGLLRQIDFNLASGQLSLEEGAGKLNGNVWTANGRPATSTYDTESDNAIFRAPVAGSVTFKAEAPTVINGISTSFDVPTAIDEIATEDAEETAYYTLQGVRVKNPVAGIYIVVRGKNVTKEIVR
ncbi:MAG: hypothetical protein HDS25_06790 [Bacteroides sp.]|nr:hypothetical protein [Bacteroides sp.]